MLLVDTGPLVAAADVDDADHQPCHDLLETDPGPLVTSPLVIADGTLRVESLTHADWTRIAQLVERYADLRLGGTDASLVVLGERFGTTRLATLNRRDFTVVRPRHVGAFELLP